MEGWLSDAAFSDRGICGGSRNQSPPPHTEGRLNLVSLLPSLQKGRIPSFRCGAQEVFWQVNE